MLKIKDSVDLKELEKFGLKEEFGYYTKRFKSGKTIIEISVDKYLRELIMCCENPYKDIDIDYQLEPLFNLIQAGLVEKVEEE